MSTLKGDNLKFTLLISEITEKQSNYSCHLSTVRYTCLENINREQNSTRGKTNANHCKKNELRSPNLGL